MWYMILHLKEGQIPIFSFSATLQGHRRNRPTRRWNALWNYQGWQLWDACNLTSTRDNLPVQVFSNSSGTPAKFALQGGQMLCESMKVDLDVGCAIHPRWGQSPPFSTADHSCAEKTSRTCPTSRWIFTVLTCAGHRDLMTISPTIGRCCTC